MNKTDFIKLSKTVSHALRHEPETYNLTLDAEGWVSMADLIAGLNTRRFNVEEPTIVEMLERTEKKRFEIRDGRIRAYYGHSVEGKIEKSPVEPPEMLYHGTIRDNLNSILEQGLLPMDRQFVHLSIDEKTAEIVGKRRKGEVVILKIKAHEANSNGIQFYKEENGIWLSDEIPSKYIDC